MRGGYQKGGVKNKGDPSSPLQTVSSLGLMVRNARVNFQLNLISSFREIVEQQTKSDDDEATIPLSCEQWYYTTIEFLGRIFIFPHLLIGGLIKGLRSN